MNIHESKWKDEVSPVLLTVAKRVAEKPEIEVEWKAFHSEIKIDEEFNVDERTQASIDVFKELSIVNLQARNTQIVTGGTYLHDQKDTNLCAYFATLSALRHQLQRATRGGISTDYIDSSNYGNIDQNFWPSLAVMISCVNPRALSVRFYKTFRRCFEGLLFHLNLLNRTQWSQY